MSSADPAANTYYVHPAGEACPSILLNLDLVESLAQWSGYAASKGHEIRGVLFGKADVDPGGPTVLAVEDCEPLFGDEPPANAAGLRPIGLVRSDLSGTLLPDDQDRESLRRLVADPNRILVIVKPGPEPTARILPDGVGGTAPFPLQRAKLTQDARSTLRVPSSRAATGRGLAAIALVLALAGGAVFWSRGRTASARRGDTALTVRADGSNYRVSWDPNSTAVRSAGSGVLHVSDAGTDRSIPLDGAQLMAGGTSYAGSAPGAAFRLELPAPAATTEVAAAVPAELPNPDIPDRSLAAGARRTPPAAPGKTRRVGTEDSEVGETRKTAPPPSVPEPSPAAPSLTVTQAERRHDADSGEVQGEKPPAPEAEADRSVPRAPAVRHPAFVANVIYRPAPENAIRRGLQKVPGLRSLQRWRFKGGDKFEPARPVHEAKPAVPARVAPSLPASAHVELEVFLDARGKVSGVEIASPGANDHLVGAATNAVYGSSFQAARLNGKPTESRLIASFDFRNGS